MSNLNTANRSDLRTLFTFFVPSLIGVFLFMTPVPIGEAMTIPIAVMAKAVQEWIGPFALGLITSIVCITGILSLVIKLFKPQPLLKFFIIKHLFDVSWLWLSVRLLGMVFIVLTYTKQGPEMIISGNTGALVLNDLLPVLFSVFVLAGLLLPLLLNFGLLELVGTLSTKVMRPLFGVPGRSAGRSWPREA